MNEIAVIAMSVLLLITVVIFAYSAWRRIKVLTLAATSNRFNNWWKRVDTLLVNMFGQKKLFKLPAAGLMHALIFWGFLILLLRSLSLIGSAYAPYMHWDVFWFSPVLSHWYAYLKDITEAVVLAMIFVSFFRRLVLKPERLTLNWDANLVIGLIGFLMLSDFLLDGGYILALTTDASVPQHIKAEIINDAAFSPIGAWIATLYKSVGISTGAAYVIFHSFFWAHIASLLFFLNFLPYSKHFHVLTVVFNVFFSNLEKGHPLKGIPNIEEEFEKEEPVIGASKLEHLQWSQILNVYTCVECGRCLLQCPANLSGKPLQPKKVMEELKGFVDDYEPYMFGKKESDDKMPDIIATIGRDVIWSCTTCRSCEENCPLMNEYVQMFVDFRRYLSMMEGDTTPEMNTTFKNLETKGNPWGLPTGDREKWTEGLNVPKISENPDAEYLFFVGCAGAYDDSYKKVSKSMVKIFEKAGISYGILGNEETCTGDSARRLGNEYLYMMLAQQNVETFNNYKVKKIITICPHCYQTIKNEYPELGGNYEVYHHTEIIDKLLNQGKIPLKNPINKKFLYHDSCYLGRYNNIYDQPRNIIKSIDGTTIVEADNNREKSVCCGAGGGYMWMEEDKGERMNVMRTKELASKSPDVIATACPFCKVMLKDGVADQGIEDNIKVMDVSEIVAQAME